MQIGPSNGLHSSAPITATSALSGAASGDSPRLKLTNMRLEDVLKTLLENTLDADDALEPMAVKDRKGPFAMNDEEMADFRKATRHMHVPGEDYSLEDNTTFNPPAGVSNGPSFWHPGMERMTRDTLFLDGLMDSLSK